MLTFLLTPTFSALNDVLCFFIETSISQSESTLK